MKKSILPIVALLTIISAACTRKVYIPLENIAYRTDTLQLNATRYDSTVSIDSVIIRNQGDTIIKEAWRWRNRERRSSSSLSERIGSGILKIAPYILFIALAAYILQRNGRDSR